MRAEQFVARWPKSTLQHRLGGGSMGQVFLARDLRLEREVAMQLSCLQKQVHYARLRLNPPFSKGVSVRLRPRIACLWLVCALTSLCSDGVTQEEPNPEAAELPTRRWQK